MTEHAPESGTQTVPVEWAQAMGSGRITLDRTNLLRLADTLDRVEAIKSASSPFRGGYEAAVESVRRIAHESPDLYGDHGYPILRPGALDDLCAAIAKAAEDGPETLRETVSALLDGLGVKRS